MKNNKKGFTLIELLAVIVILGVLLAIAIPSVAKYINSAKKSTYVDNVQSYVKAARQEVLINNSPYALPVNNNEATVIAFSTLASALDNGGKTSSYGGEFVAANSFIVIVNENTVEEPQFVYYIAAIDDKGYGIGTDASHSAAINYDSLKEVNIVQLGSGKGFTKPAVGSKITVSTKSGDSYTTKQPTIRYSY